MTEYVFLYGTLMPEFAEPGIREVVARLSFVGRGTVPGLLFDLGPYPALVVDSTGDSRVLGSVFELPADADLLTQLDDYEGFDPMTPTASLYLRKALLVTMTDRATLTAHTYVYNRPIGNAEPIPDGDYLAWRR